MNWALRYLTSFPVQLLLVCLRQTKYVQKPSTEYGLAKPSRSAKLGSPRNAWEQALKKHRPIKNWLTKLLSRGEHTSGQTDKNRYYTWSEPRGREGMNNFCRSLSFTYQFATIKICFKTSKLLIVQIIQTKLDNCKPHQRLGQVKIPSETPSFTVCILPHHHDYKRLSKLSLVVQGEHLRSDPDRVQSTN